MTNVEDDVDGDSSAQMIENNESDSVNMHDPYYVTYILFYALGVLTLVPANFFTTATDYWMYKFRNTSLEVYSSENRTGLQAEFTSNYSIVSNVSSVLFLALTVIILPKITAVKRMIGSIGGVIVMFAITILFVQLNTDSWQRSFFAVSLAIGFFLAGFTAAFTVTVFDLVSRFPPRYILALLSGQAICGIFAALVQIFSLAIGASSITNGLVYFAVGMVFVLLTLLCFLTTLTRSDFFKHHLNKQVQQIARPKMTKKMFLSILNKLKYLLFSMIFVLGSSIVIHPGVTSLVVSVHKGNGSKWNDVFFVPVITFFCYHSVDYIGREIAGIVRRPRNGIVILAISFFRIALVPLLMFCNAQPRTHLPVLFDNDYIYIIFIILLGISNGYLVNLCVIQVPVVTTMEEKQIALVIILIFMVVSLGACSFLSAAAVKAL